jgi:hypothetical protein
MIKQETENTKIHAVFLSAGRPVGFGAYRKYHPNVKIPENQEILQRVKDECEGVEFVGKAEPVGASDAIPKIKEQKENLAGLLVFGAPPDELIQVGLPMVAVERPLEGCTTVPFHAYKESKVVTSYLPAHCDKDPKVYSLRIEDIAGKIKLIDTISKMKGLRVLVVTDQPPLGYFEPIGLQIGPGGREEYEKVYLDNLKETFGTEFIAVPQKELLDEKMQTVDEEEATQVAQKWIEGAIALRGTNEEQVLRSAKLYLGMKELMDEHNCGAITTEGFGWPPLGYDAGPSAGMPISQLCTDGIAAATETLTDCLITQQLALYITGSAGLLGDYNIDPFNNTAIVCHCEGSFKPYGDERKAPYLIRNLPFVAENTGGACIEIHYPIGETVTVAKISIYGKKLSIFTGETVSGEELFPYWEDILGRNKIAVKTDAKALLENVDWKTFGNHRTAFFGDYRHQFQNLAQLIGFEVVEKDR